MDQTPADTSWQSTAPPQEICKVYVGNLTWRTTETQLSELFSPFGQVLDSIILRDKESGKSRGFGFVTLGSHEEAHSAINHLAGHIFDGRPLRVNLANESRVTQVPLYGGFQVYPYYNVPMPMPVLPFPPPGQSFPAGQQFPPGQSFTAGAFPAGFPQMVYVVPEQAEEGLSTSPPPPSKHRPSG